LIKYLVLVLSLIRDQKFTIQFKSLPSKGFHFFTLCLNINVQQYVYITIPYWKKFETYKVSEQAVCRFYLCDVITCLGPAHNGWRILPSVSCTQSAIFYDLEQL